MIPSNGKDPIPLAFWYDFGQPVVRLMYLFKNESTYFQNGLKKK
jgi:hypothetical protein